MAKTQNIFTPSNNNGTCEWNWLIKLLKAILIFFAFGFFFSRCLVLSYLSFYFSIFRTLQPPVKWGNHLTEINENTFWKLKDETRRKWRVRINYALGKFSVQKLLLDSKKHFMEFFSAFRRKQFASDFFQITHSNLSRYRKPVSIPSAGYLFFFDHLHFRLKLKFNPTEIHYLFRFAAFNFGLFPVAMTICRLMRSNLLKTN